MIEPDTIWIDRKHEQLFIYHDGGRSMAGYRGFAGDCGTRAAAIVLNKPYREVYKEFNKLGKKERSSWIREIRGKSSGGNGIWLSTLKKYMFWHGFVWVPVNCRLHLRGDELPKGRLLLRISKHYTAMVDGILYDNQDCSDEGMRSVYGYFYKP